MTIILGAAILAAVLSLSLPRWLSPPPAPALDAGWDAVVTVLAGDGVAGMRDGAAARARFSDPFGVAAAADGSIYVADAGDAQRVRRIALDGTVSTVAGGERGYADGPASSARFNTPSGLAVDAQGVLYVADTGNNAIRRLTPDGNVATAAGGGAAGYLDATGSQARFNGPAGLAVDPAGRVIVADTYNDRIRAIERDGRVTTLAGSGSAGAADGPSHEASFDTPCGVAVDAAGNIYVADTGNGVVRAISPAGTVSTLAWPADAPFRPIGIAVSSAGVLYVTDERGRLIEITPDGAVRTVAGSRPGFADGRGPDARFRSLAGLTFTAPGRLVVTDPRNALVRTVEDPVRMEVRPPASPRINPRFDSEAFGLAPLLWPRAPMFGPFEITGTLGESRGGSGQERFHAGLDVQAPQGTPVLAVRDGVVASATATNAFDTLNESVGIGPLRYVHMRVGRHVGNVPFDDPRFAPAHDDTGRLVQMRVKRGARFQTGDQIGTVNAFNHVHLNVGWAGEEQNPLQFRLVQFEDTVPPSIARGGVRLFGEDGQALTERSRRRLLVGGRVTIVVDAWDQVNGNKPQRRLGVYRLGYQVLDDGGSPVPGFETARETIRFDRLGIGEDAARLVYASGSGIPFYGGRTTRFLYVVTSTLRGGVASPGAWDTRTLPPGDYTLRILAADIRGNEAIANRDVLVTIAPPAPQ